MDNYNKDVKRKRIKQIFYLIRAILDWIMDFIFFLIYYFHSKHSIKPTKQEFLTKSAVSIATSIRKKELSAEEVVHGFIKRIKEVNEVLNAVVADRFDDAIREAKEVDAFLASTKLSIKEIEHQKPFLGVPFTSKESTSAKGMAFTFGLISRKGVVASEDAEIVKRIKNSGAILVAVTNVPELNLWCETRNNLYGQTRNPYDITKTVGGSSGGESCIVTACGSAMGIGTDIGGSTRMPAFYCGIFGHKPTTGFISTSGMTFRTGEEKDTMVTAGTITRYSEDILPFLKILLGDNVKHLQLDIEVKLKNIKVFYIDDPDDLRVSPISSEMKNVIYKAADHLSNVCSSVSEKVNISGFKNSLLLWRHGMSKEPSNFAKDLGNQQVEVSLMSELPKLAVGQCNFTLPALMRLIDLKILPPTSVEWAEKETEMLMKDVSSLLGDEGVLLFPSCPMTAPYHYTPLLRPYNFAYWAVFNVLKLPVTQVPMGLCQNGLPLGIQVVAGLNNDHLSIAVARELENAFGGWVPPFPSNT